MNFAGTTNYGTVSSAWAFQGTGDFNGDGAADLLWVNSGARQVAVWTTRGIDTPSHGPGIAFPVGWSFQGLGDFNGDGKVDIFWRHTAGATSAWFMNGTAVSTHAEYGAPSSSWAITGFGDYNADGMTDVFWRNSTTGQTSTWLVRGNTASFLPSASVGPTWQTLSINPEGLLIDRCTVPG